jgi:hypothetical protein
MATLKEQFDAELKALRERFFSKANSAPVGGSVKVKTKNETVGGQKINRLLNHGFNARMKI